MVASIYEDSRVVQDPLNAPLMGPSERPDQILDVKLFRLFLSIPDEFGVETSTIGRVLKLSFQPYKERPNPTLYATWASILLRAVPGVRN